MQPMAPSAAANLRSENRNQPNVIKTLNRNVMKTKLQSVLFSAVLAAGMSLAVPAFAQAEGGEGQPRRERRMDPAARLEAMKERLGLSEEQVAKIKEIFAAEREEIAAKRKELGDDPAPEARRAAMQPIREKYRAQMEAVLTEEQKAKLPKPGEWQNGPRGQGDDKPKRDGAGGPPDA